ncbi:uncharacterized protein [Nicotiana sylvestris]|uniref:uncharacterized protein n=1 Tax=Nicotiana sylvestris TaxID=4096 RepID=UPI00388C9886
MAEADENLITSQKEARVHDWNTMSPNILNGISYASNAHLVWEDLREWFDKSMMQWYLLQIRRIMWITFSDKRLLQFLSRLNDTYSQARRHILIKSVEPTLNQAYAMIVEYETHKAANIGLNPVVNGNDITALWSAKVHQQKPKKNCNIQCEHCKLKGHTKENWAKW